MKPDLILYRGVRAILVAFARIYFRLRVEGREHVPTDRPFILAPVHRSNVDFLLVSAVTARRMRYMGKDSLWKHKTLGWFLSALGAFPVHRGSADREALRQCIDLAMGGEPLVMFPEGTRQSGPLVQDFFEGASYVASRTQIPVVPVGIGGSEQAMPKGSKFIRPRRIALIVGPPLEPPPMKESGRPSRTAVKDMTARLHEEVQKLFDTAQSRVGA